MARDEGGEVSGAVEALPPGLADPLAACRSALRRAVGREAAVVVTTGALAALVIASLFAAIGWSHTALAWTELSVLLATSAFVFARYLVVLRQGTGSLEATAAWLDRALGSRDTRTSILSALELERDRGRYGESPSLADLAVRTVTESAKNVDPKRIVAREAWPPLRARLFRLLAAAIVFAGLVFVMPGAVGRAATALFVRGLSNNPLVPSLPEPRLSDFRITYRAPAYAGRPAVTIESATGDLRALPGTEVTIDTRAHEALSSAVIIVSYGVGDEETQTFASEVSGRKLRANLVLHRSGRYRIELTTQDKKRFAQKSGQRIELEPDLPPLVRLSKPSVSPLEVNEQDRVELAFRAEDDFGLGEIRVAWRLLGSGREGRQKLSVDKGSSIYRGTAAFELRDLQLEPGDRVAYSVEAVDNDTVNGPKVGASDTKELKVYSKDEHHQEVLRVADKALDEIVHVLGDQLEKPLGPAKDQAAAEALVSAVEKGIDRAAACGELLDEAVAAIKKDPLGRKQIAQAFENARKELRRDTRSFAISFRAARSQQDRLFAGDAVRSQGKLVGTLEKHSVYLADLLNDTRMLDAEALTKRLRDQQERLRQTLADYKNAPTEEKRKVLQAAIAEIRRQVSEIAKKLAALRGSIPDDLIGAEAMEAASTERGLDEITKKIESGDLDGATADLEKMLQGTEEAITKMQAGRNELGQREYAQVSETAQQLWDELKDVKAEQDVLAEATERISKRAIDRVKNRLGDVSAFVEKQRERIAEAAKNVEETEPVARVSEGDAFEQSLRRLDDTGRALDGRDFGAAAEMAEASRDSIRQLRAELERRSSQISRFGDFFGSSDGLDEAQSEIARAEPKIEQVLEDLEKMIPKPEQLLTPEERRQLDDLADKQRDAQQRGRRVSQLLNQLGEELPVVGDNAKQLAEAAESAMGRAADEMGQGDSRGAEGEQRQAMESIGQLEDALKQMGRGGSGSGDERAILLPFGEGEGEGGEPMNTGEGDDPRPMEKVEIPKPEQFEAPAAFRQDILEAAKHGAARGYEDAVRRYYEEIVK
ncbi:MAG: DUF4175 family protein [Deltaproteobacteria bacterium]|nr:DUF4175 family protein [Deltaproteobacteria bacterium]